MRGLGLFKSDAFHLDIEAAATASAASSWTDGARSRGHETGWTIRKHGESALMFLLNVEDNAEYEYGFKLGSPLSTEPPPYLRMLLSKFHAKHHAHYEFYTKSEQHKPDHSLTSSYVHSQIESVSLDDQLNRLLSLSPGWDGENAIPPSELAVGSAKTIIKHLPPDLLVSEIEPDVTGGVAVWITMSNADSDRWTWFSCKNSGKVLFACDVHIINGECTVKTVDTTDSAYQSIRNFLAKKENK